MSRKVLYFDCFSGISGDMTVGALIDLGGDGEAVKAAIAKLPLEEPVEISWNVVNRTGITATKFDVQLDGHHHGAHHEHDEPAHAHHHRSHREIVSMIERSDLGDGVKRRATEIFARIAAAEAKIHGVPVDEVHFHEVGAVDSIVDIVSTALLVEALAPDIVAASPVAVGSGRVKTMHGLYPVPAPATLEILKGAPVEAGSSAAELTTPTGAGILAATVDTWDGFPDMEVSGIGYGAGTKEFPDRPNVLRVVLGTLREKSQHDHAHHHHHDH